MKNKFQRIHIYFLKSFKYFNGFISSIWITVVKVILQLREIKNGIPFMKNISAIINTYFWISMSSLGIITISPDTWISFFLVVLPFKAEIFLPQIAGAMSISWTVTGKSMVCWFWKIHLKSLTVGYPSLVYKVFVCSAPSICILDNDWFFTETVFISTNELSVGL